jgi:hypothetical protein
MSVNSTLFITYEPDFGFSHTIPSMTMTHNGNANGNNIPFF